MTSLQITRLLALSVEWRRRLAEQDGPGWLVSTAWRWSDNSLYPRSCDVPRMPLRLKETPAGHRCAWAPCCRLAWLRATGARPWVVDQGRDGDGLACANCGGTGWFDDPIDAALTYMEQHACPVTV